MHPVIRLSCLAAIAVLLPWWPPQALYLFAATLVLVAIARPGTVRLALQAIRRMRWLLLSIMVLYGWFTPGQALLPALGVLSPTLAGGLLAVQRALVLILMVSLVVIVIHGLPRPLVGAALIRLFGVTGPLGRRFGRRMSLMFAALPEMEQRARQALREPGTFTERAAGLIMAIESRSEPAAAAEAELPPVPPGQWLLPAALLACGILLILLGEH